MKFQALFVAALLSSIAFGPVNVWASDDKSAAEAPDDSKGQPAAPTPEKGKGGDEGKSKKATDVSGGQFAGDPVYVHLPPLILPILGNTGPEQLVTLQITVEVKDLDAADSIHAHMPRVLDSLMQQLYGGLGNGNLRNGRLVDVVRIKTKAMGAMQTVIGNDNVKDVLIVNVSQRLL